MSAGFDDEPTNGLRQRRDSARLAPVDDEAPTGLRVNITPKMMLAGIGILLAGGAGGISLRDVLGLAPVHAESAPAPVANERVAKIETKVEQHGRVLERLVTTVENIDKNLATLTERTPARRQR